MAEGRIIKSSAFTSDSISRLSDFQFRLWVGLITHADNVGRGDARAAILKGQIFPLREKVRDSDIQKGLQALATNGSIFLYEVSGKPFYAFPNWREHQRLRNESSKFPAPPQLAATRGEPPQLAATRGLEEEGKGREEEEEEEVEGKYICTEPQSAAVLTLSLNDGTEYPITQEYIDQMQELYPGVDVLQAFRSMKAWCINNPKKRKTARGIKAFIGNWLAKEQDRGGKAKQTGRKVTTFMDL